MDKIIASLIDLRGGSDRVSSNKYASYFRRAIRFVIYGNEFIPFELFKESRSGKRLLQTVIDEHGDAQVLTKYDKKLSKFYKKHGLKREINYIADSISYLKIPGSKPEKSAEAQTHDAKGYDLETLMILASYQSQAYNAKDAQLQSIGQSYADNLLSPTNDWLESICFDGFVSTPERYWQVAGTFKKRIWGKLQHQDLVDQKVFLCLGVDLEKETLFYGLECLRTGTSKLSTEQIYKFDLFTKGLNIMCEIPLVDLAQTPWHEVVNKSSNYLKKLISVYHSSVEYIWKDKVNLKEVQNKLLPLSVKKPQESEEILDTNKKTNALALELVIRYEKDYLKYKGKKELAKKISKDKLFDVSSYELDGSKKKIKLIASNSASIQGALIGQSEVDYSIVSPDHSYLYIITKLNMKKKSGLLFISKGRLDRVLDLKPERYSVLY